MYQYNNILPQILKHFMIKEVMDLKQYINIETHFSIKSDFKQFIDVEIRSDALISTQVMGLKQSTNIETFCDKGNDWLIKRYISIETYFDLGSRFNA